MDWKKKLTSRKFWAALAGFVTGLVAFITSPSGSPEAITGLIMSFGTLVAYIVGEGLVDAAGAGSPVDIHLADAIQPENKPPEEEQ